MSNPLKQLSAVFSEGSALARQEFLPHPAIPTDYFMNEGLFAIWNWVRRMMLGVVGDVVLSGFDITLGSPGGTLTVSEGEILTKYWYFNVTSPNNYVHSVTTDMVLYLQCHNERTPRQVAVPGGGGFRDSVNALRGNINVQHATVADYNAAIATISGIGYANSVFVRSSGSWGVDAVAGYEVECYDTDGRLIGPFTVASNTADTLTFEKDANGNDVSASGAASVVTHHYVKLADVATSGLITPVFTALDDLRIGTAAHLQNTDTHTDGKFYVDGTPSTGYRVLDVRDMTPGTTDTTTFTVLTTVTNLLLSTETRFEDNFGTALIKADWGIEGTGNYTPATDTFAVSAGHNGASSISTNELVNFLFEDSTGEHYKITANTSGSAGGAFTVTIAPAVGQSEPSNGAFVIRNAAEYYRMVVQSYDSTNTSLVPGYQTLRIDPDSNGSLQTHAYMTGFIVGRKYSVTIQSHNPSLTPPHFSTGNTIIVGDTSSVTVNMSTVTANPYVGGVYFTWPQPTNFDAALGHRTQFAWEDDGTSPTYSNTSIKSGTTSRYGVKVTTDPGNNVNFKARIIDSAGNTLGTESTAEGVALGSDTKLVPILNKTSALDLADGDFDVEDFAEIDEAYYPYRVAVKAIDFRVSTLAGSGTPQVKVRVQSYDNPSAATTGTVVASAGSAQLDEFSSQPLLGKRIQIGIEKIQGTITDLDCMVYVYFVYETSNPQTIS